MRSWQKPTVNKLQTRDTRGLQKNFANDDDRVAVLDSQSGALIAADRPIKSNWSEQNFLTVVDAAGNLDQSLENEFAKTEQKALNQIRDITPNKISPDQNAPLIL
jgi:uncharacterized membrane protein